MTDMRCEASDLQRPEGGSNPGELCTAHGVETARSCITKPVRTPPTVANKACRHLAWSLIHCAVASDRASELVVSHSMQCDDAPREIMKDWQPTATAGLGDPWQPAGSRAESQLSTPSCNVATVQTRGAHNGADSGDRRTHVSEIRHLAILAPENSASPPS